MMIYFSPTILDFVMPLNESRRMMFDTPFAIEYYVPWRKFTYLLQLYMLLLMFVTSNSILAAEILTIACLQHIHAMFVITSYRIERAVNKSQKFSLDLAKNVNDHKNIVEVIDSHLRAIQSSDFLRSLCGIIYLIFIPLAIISLSINMYQFSRYISLSDVTNAALTFLFLFLHLIIVFSNNFVGQKIINHSEIVFKTICNTQWYTTSLYMQKCLLLIMQRSMKSSTLKVGGLYVPSFESFLSVKQQSTLSMKDTQKNRFPLLLFTRDTCLFDAAHPQILIVLYGDLLHTVVITELGYAIIDEYNQREFLYFHEE
ncbi:uncharacterized protein LOC116845936 [Odontomachus brunneus]|uniref:uncharacterized protein LOC116845936 n=1 Tax=Odontomachus brunneus TaxID=486640 RepID=UPI0013F1BF24|nr:uncharacterized protein LOC116845936 [Odontomachus brunneus]